MKRAPLLLALAVLVAACGGNSEDIKVFNQRRDLCNSLNGKAETIGQVRSDFQATGLQGPTEANGISCQNFITPGGSTCAQGQTTCKVFWQTIALDSSLCNLGSCVYACIAYVPGQSAADATVDSAVVCGTQFVSGQPFFF